MQNKKKLLTIIIPILFIVVALSVATIVIISMPNEEKPIVENDKEFESNIDLRIETFRIIIEPNESKIKISFLSFQPKDYELVTFILNDVEYYTNSNGEELEKEVLDEEKNVLRYSFELELNNPNQIEYKLTQGLWINSSTEDKQVRVFELFETLPEDKICYYKETNMRKQYYSFETDTNISLYIYNPFSFEIKLFENEMDYELKEVEQIGYLTKVIYKIKNDVKEKIEGTKHLKFDVSHFSCGETENEIIYDLNINEIITYSQVPKTYEVMQEIEIFPGEESNINLTFFCNYVPNSVYIQTENEEIINVELSENLTFAVDDSLFRNSNETYIKILGFGYLNENTNEEYFDDTIDKTITITMIPDELNLTAKIFDNTKLYGEVNKVYIEYSKPDKYRIDSIELSNGTIVTEIFEDETGYYFETKIEKNLSIVKTCYSKNDIELIDESTVEIEGTLRSVPGIEKIDFNEVLIGESIICHVSLQNSNIDENNIEYIDFKGNKIVEFEMIDDVITFNTNYVETKSGNYQYNVVIVFKNAETKEGKGVCLVKPAIVYKSASISTTEEGSNYVALELENTRNYDITKVDFAVATDVGTIEKQGSLVLVDGVYRLYIDSVLDELRNYTNAVVTIRGVYYEVDSIVSYQRFDNAFAIL